MITVDPVPWTHDPWGAELDDGKIYGRGACDMKPGTTASIWTLGTNSFSKLFKSWRKPSTRYPKKMLPNDFAQAPPARLTVR